MPGPGAHLLYALSGGAALSRLAGPGDRRFGAHHCAVYAANAFLGPDLGAFAEWLCSFLPSSASASAAGDLAMSAVHHPFYYPLLLGLPLTCAYAWLSRRLLRAGVLDSPGGVPLNKRQCFLLISAGSLSHFFLDHLFEENGHSKMYTWILSTGWWKGRAPINPDAVVIVGLLCTCLIGGFVYIHRVKHGKSAAEKSNQSFFLILVIATLYCMWCASQIYLRQPPQPAIGYEDKGCNLFNGTWVRDFRGPIYTNFTCPTMPDSKNCGKYGKQMDYVNWKWVPHGCDMVRFEPQLFLNIVRGKTMAFAADSIGRNQMESLLCLLSQVETPIKVYSDTKDKFVTWHFKSHNFTLMALWTKFFVEGSEREINGTEVEMHDIHLDKLDARLAANLREINILVISSSRWFFRKNYLYEGGKLIGCIYCSEDNITSIDVITAIQRALRTALRNLTNCQECGLQLTLVRTATPAHFENGFWNTGGYCNRTEPVEKVEAMTRTVEWAIRNAQVEEANRAQNESSHKGQMNLEILDITEAMSMRPDAHPGIHWNNKWMRGYSDCSHWCLPGPIDMWNELLLSVLKKYGKE